MAGEVTTKGTELEPNHNCRSVNDAFGWDKSVIDGQLAELCRLGFEANAAGVPCCHSRIIQQIASVEGTERQKIRLALCYGKTLATREIKEIISMVE